VVRDGKFVHVTMGTLVDDPSIRPTRHIFVGSKAPWFTITDDLPQYETLTGLKVGTPKAHTRAPRNSEKAAKAISPPTGSPGSESLGKSERRARSSRSGREHIAQQYQCRASVVGTLTVVVVPSSGGSEGWHATRGSHSHARSGLRAGQRDREGIRLHRRDAAIEHHHLQ
jgi:hypothetical protein